ncbi:hypothetical protein Thi970DRAFT_03184, partial [Thiorhodovibrio frisius]
MFTSARGLDFQVGDDMWNTIGAHKLSCIP